MGRAIVQIDEHVQQLELQGHRELSHHLAAKDSLLASERAGLLASVRTSVNNALVQSVGADGSNAPLDCAEQEARDVCVSIEAATSHQLLPPLFSLSPLSPGLWHALSQLPTPSRLAPGEATRRLLEVIEAVASPGASREGVGS